MQVWLRRIFLLPVYFYRYVVSPVLPKACRYHPSCSVYAIEAVLLHGIFRGSWLAVRRVARCHPWAEGGFDPVPPPSFRDKKSHSP